ncbi:MAG TPA: aryl-sulfate sulfotransferase [Methanomicrobiales archaeon]|nr:aryl-sulfate sulfotransferase [Methanomicrobiales archaeon]
MKLSSLLLAVLLAGTALLAACTQTAPPASPPATTEAIPATGEPPVTMTIPVSTPGSPPATVVQTATATQPAGTTDPSLQVDVYVPEKAWQGVTIFADHHDPARPRIVEVNMKGEVTWEYDLPAELKAYTNPGQDVEPLANGDLLVLFPKYGVYEITRAKKIAWKYLDPKVSHDADRLPDGNTLIAFGADDTMNDMQVKEVNPAGTIVWSWHAKDAFNRAPYLGISDGGWTHTNAVTRLANGDTLVSLRNFNLIAEVDRSGKLVRTYGDGVITQQHDPEMQPDGNFLMANLALPNAAIEMAPDGTILWRFPFPEPGMWPVRDVDRLPNGNILVTAADRILELTPDKEVVWQLRLANTAFTDRQSGESRGFYKAERVSDGQVSGG